MVTIQYDPGLQRWHQSPGEFPYIKDNKLKTMWNGIYRPSEMPSGNVESSYYSYWWVRRSDTDGCSAAVGRQGKAYLTL
jgi:hypothetical protein